MKPIINIVEENKEVLTGMLANVLADSIMLYSKMREIHWTVKGENFMELNNLFEGQYTKLEDAINEIAVLKKELGGPAPATFKNFEQPPSLKITSDKSQDKNDMLKELLCDHETIIKFLNKNIFYCDKKYSDTDIADFLRCQLKKYQTIAWALRSYLMNDRKAVA